MYYLVDVMYLHIYRYKRGQVNVCIYIYMHVYRNSHMCIQNSLSTTYISIHMFHGETGRGFNWSLFKSYVIILVWKENYMII